MASWRQQATALLEPPEGMVRQIKGWPWKMWIWLVTEHLEAEQSLEKRGRGNEGWSVLWMTVSLNAITRRRAAVVTGWVVAWRDTFWRRGRSPPVAQRRQCGVSRSGPWGLIEGIFLLKTDIEKNKFNLFFERPRPPTRPKTKPKESRPMPRPKAQNHTGKKYKFNL